MSRIGAVIFDLDGTLTQPILDFDAIRRETGIDGPVLEGLLHLGAEARRRAEEILERHERDAAAASTLQAGAAELIDELRRRGVRTAVLTRNSRESLRCVLERHSLRFDALRSREDGPNKPDPRPVLELCEQLGVAPAETLVVGDYLFDLEAANSAGAISVLLEGPGNRRFADRARRRVRGLAEILELLDGLAGPEDFPNRAAAVE